MEKRQNYSRKRESILQAICSTDIHPTADWIYQHLKPVYPDLSLGTVYRNIAKFKEDGVVVSVGVVKGQERLDGNTIPHPHFICNVCGRVIDLNAVELAPAISRQVSKSYPYQIDYCDLIFHGRCDKCQEEKSRGSSL